MVLGDRYVLEQQLGRGGWGTVWRVRHRVIGKVFAVKILRQDRGADAEPNAPERLLREAIVLSQIDDPSVVDVVDFGTVGNAPYIVMEFLEGDTLSVRLRAGALSWAEAKPLLAQTLSGLAAAHAIGVVHRDIKPSNLFLLTEGRGLKVIDFGIASGTDGIRLTEAGFVLGTPHFMSPEQTRGTDVGLASDIYSVACVAYSMLAGRPPYIGSRSEVVRQHLMGPVPEMDAGPIAAAPLEVRAAIKRALAKRPDERFASMRAFYEALIGEPMVSSRMPVDEVSAAASQSAASLPRRPRRWMGLRAALLLLGTTAAALAGWGMSEHRPRVETLARAFTASPHVFEVRPVPPPPPPPELVANVVLESEPAEVVVLDQCEDEDEDENVTEPRGAVAPRRRVRTRRNRRHSDRRRRSPPAETRVPKSLKVGDLKNPFEKD